MHKQRNQSLAASGIIRKPPGATHRRIADGFVLSNPESNIK
jgi:hypothetical protein